MVDEESGNNGRTARMTALVAAMLAIMLVGVPSFLSDPVSLSMVGRARSIDSESEHLHDDGRGDAHIPML